MRRKYGLFLILLAFATGLAYLGRNWIFAVVVVPLAELLQALLILSGVFSPLVYWAFFLLALVSLAYFTLQRPPFSRRRASSVPVVIEGRARTWRAWLKASPNGRYFRWRLAHHLSNLVLDTIASQEGISRERALEDVRAGDFGLSPEMRAYILEGVNERSFLRNPEPVRRLRFWMTRPQVGFSLPPEQILELLESWLDGTPTEEESRLTLQEKGRQVS